MEFLIQPWRHQLEAIHKMKDLSSYALFFEQGTGKTGTMINTLRYKYAQAKEILPTLIFTPKIVVRNWVNEFAIHSKISPEYIVPLVGSEKKRLGLLESRHKKARIFVTNYEALIMEKLFTEFMHWAPKFLILDESHRVKALTSKRTKRAIKLADICSERFLLSGTPMPNSPMDIWAQFRVLDRGKAFGTNFFVWRSNYFFDRNYRMPAHRHFPDWVLREDMAKGLNLKIAANSMRVKKNDCLDLPPLVKQRIEVELSSEQIRTYQEMKKDLLTFLEDKACVAQLAITKALRLQQILSGFLPVLDDAGEQVLKRFDPCPRLDALGDLLSDLAPAHKVIVWATFRENYAMIRELCDKLKIRYVECHGEVSDSEKNMAVQAFNTEADVRVFIGHPGSGGIGINLVSSDIAIFYSRNFSLEQDIQAEARNHRAGSERHQKITRIDFVVPNSLDEEILKALERKEAISEKLLREVLLK